MSEMGAQQLGEAPERALLAPIGMDGTPEKLPRQKRRKDRLKRNDMERDRRVRYNSRLMDLASMVPTIVNARKRLDKISILRLTVNYLTLYKELQALEGSQSQWTTALLKDQLSSLILESLGGFLMVVHTSGSVLYVSSEIENSLGVSKVDVLGMNINTIIHPDDKNAFSDFLTSKNDSKVTSSQAGDGPAMQKAGCLRMISHTKGQDQCYIPVEVRGQLRLSSSPTKGEAAPRGMLLAVVKRVQDEMALELPPDTDSDLNQWLGYVQLDGSLICQDHRGILITGFMTGELRGLSAYQIMHKDDIPYAINSHKTMLESNGTIIPWTALRLYSSDGSIIYTYITSHLVVDAWTKKPRYLLSVNNKVQPSYGEKLLEKQRLRFSKMSLTKDLPTSVSESVIPKWLSTPLDRPGDTASPTSDSDSDRHSKPGSLTMETVSIVSTTDSQNETYSNFVETVHSMGSDSLSDSMGSGGGGVLSPDSSEPSDSIPPESEMLTEPLTKSDEHKDEDYMGMLDNLLGDSCADDKTIRTDLSTRISIVDTTGIAPSPPSSSSKPLIYYLLSQEFDDTQETSAFPT